MIGLYVRLLGLMGSLAALPILELELLDYLRGLEFRTFLSQSVVAPLLSALVTALVQLFFNGLFGVM